MNSEIVNVIRDVYMYWCGIGCTRSCCVKKYFPYKKSHRLTVRKYLNIHMSKFWGWLKETYCTEFLFYLLNEPIKTNYWEEGNNKYVLHRMFDVHPEFEASKVDGGRPTLTGYDDLREVFRLFLNDISDEQLFYYDCNFEWDFVAWCRS